MITAIILAAGKGERMGRLKQLLPWAHTTLLGKVVENVRGSRLLGDILLVVGYRAEEVLRGIPLEGLRVVRNPQYAEGMSSSLKAALRHLSPTTRAIMVILGDQPLIGAEIIDLLLKSYLSHSPPKGIVYPTYQGRRGHPVIIDRKYEPEMRDLEGDKGCREIIAAHPEDSLPVPVDTAAVLQDIDQPADLEEIRSLMEKGDEAHGL